MFVVALAFDWLGSLVARAALGDVAARLILHLINKTNRNHNGVFYFKSKLVGVLNLDVFKE